MARAVALYALLMNASEAGAGKMMLWGSEGGEEFRSGIEQLGGEVKAQYVLTGRYDLLTIVDFAQDDIGLLSVSLGAWPSGMYVEAIRAYPLEDLERARAKIPALEEYRQSMLAGPTWEEYKQGLVEFRDQINAEIEEIDATGKAENQPGERGT